jgi:hypothetical protein
MSKESAGKRLRSQVPSLKKLLGDILNATPKT